MAEGGSIEPLEPPKFSLVTSTDPLRQKLWQARQQGNFSDFGIEVNDIRIPCHKLILSVQSEYFSCMLQHENTVEVTQGSVDLKLLDVDAVKLVVDFMYSGRLEFEFHMVQEAIKVMDRFQLTETILHVKISEYIIPHLCPDNCIGWFKFGDQMNLEKIKMAAQSIMMERMSDVCKSSEFVSMSFNELKDYIRRVTQSHSIHDQCLKACVTWTMHDASERSRTFQEMLQIVNLKKCSARVLKNIIENQGKVLMNNFDVLHQFTTATLSRGISEPTHDIIVVGGYVNTKILNRKTWILNLESGGSIEKSSRKKIERAAMCASPDGLISAGGTPTGLIKDAISDCVLYHKKTDTWIDLPSLQAPTCGAGATCVQDAFLMVVGGRKDRKRKAICLDLRTRKWTTCHDMPQGVAVPIVASVDACVFVIFSTFEPNETERIGSEISVQCYDTTTSTWTFKSPLPKSIKTTCGARAVTTGGQLYLVGGLGPICARYDPTLNNWTILSPPLGHFGAALVVNGKILLSGGVKDGKHCENIEEYDPSTDTWKLLPVKLPAPLFDHCMILG